MSDDNKEINRSGAAAAGENPLGQAEVDPPPHFGSSESYASSLALASPTVNRRRSPLKSVSLFLLVNLDPNLPMNECLTLDTFCRFAVPCQVAPFALGTAYGRELLPIVCQFV